MAKETNAVWSELDVETLPSNQREAYEAYKVAQRAAAELRAKFEQMVNDEALVSANGQKIIFGYRFGKLSVAVVEDEGKPKKAAVAKRSLGDFLASQQAQGKRA